MPLCNKIKAGIIGFGRMGEMYLKQMMLDERWDIAYICDIDSEALSIAGQLAPDTTRLVSDNQILFEDPDIRVVVLATLADSRKEHLLKANRLLLP